MPADVASNLARVYMHTNPPSRMEVSYAHAIQPTGGVAAWGSNGSISSRRRFCFGGFSRADDNQPNVNHDS